MIDALNEIRSSSEPRRRSPLGGRGYRLLRRVKQFLLHAVLVAWAVMLMVPVVWLLTSSLKTDREFITYPPRLLPQIPQWQNYYDVIVVARFLTYAGRTILLAAMFTVTNIASCSLAGYAFARIGAPGRNTLFIIMLSAFMVPGIVTIIPQFIIYSRIKIVNTYWPWFLWGLAGSAPQIFLFRQFFSTLPVELEDAASVDGCGPFRTFWQIFLPNSKPVLAVTALFAFQWVWGDYFNQALLLTEDKATLAMKLASAFVDPHGNTLVTVTIAAIVIYIIPLVAAYFLSQKQIVQGIAATGIK
jgi:ABC-type glycerol-3-phosphate transport system permease component